MFSFVDKQKNTRNSAVTGKGLVLFQSHSVLFSNGKCGSLTSTGIFQFDWKSSENNDGKKTTGFKMKIETK